MLSSFETLRQKVNEEIAECRLRQAFAQRQLALATQHMRFTQSDLDKAVSNLNAESAQLEAEAQAANTDLENRKRELADAREEYARKLREPSQTVSSETLRRLQEAVDLRNAQVETGNEVIAGLRQLLEGVGIERQVWQITVSKIVLAVFVLVTGIGIRSSIVQFWDGVETLIPNSALLENNLTNWTYSNRTIRFTLSVGVAYGSDTTGVSRLLAEVADRHGLVLKDPKPQVLFRDFSDSTLCFELRFWIDVSKHNSAQVSSDLRHMIAGAFADHGISMAFPQRDVHLDSSRPLRVEVIPPAAAPHGVTEEPS